MSWTTLCCKHSGHGLSLEDACNDTVDTVQSPQGHFSFISFSGGRGTQPAERLFGWTEPSWWYRFYDRYLIPVKHQSLIKCRCSGQRAGFVHLGVNAMIPTHFRSLNTHRISVPSKWTSFFQQCTLIGFFIHSLILHVYTWHAQTDFWRTCISTCQIFFVP